MSCTSTFFLVSIRCKLILCHGQQNDLHSSDILEHDKSLEMSYVVVYFTVAVSWHLTFEKLKNRDAQERGWLHGLG